MRLRVATGAILAAATLSLQSAGAGSYFPPPPDVHPVWSPDASTIAYYRYGARDQAGIRVVLPDGSGDRRLAGVPTTTPYFAFSPDWKLLALVEYTGSPGAARLLVLPPEQGPVRVLATNASALVGPAFSPDGSRIAFAANDGIWTVPAAGGAPLRIANEFGKNFAWSPDGTHLAYDDNGNPPSVKIASANGSGVSTAAKSPSTGPAWSPDGKTLAYFGAQKRLWTETGGKATSYQTQGWTAPAPLWSPGGALYYVSRDLYRLDLVSGRSLRVGPAGSEVTLSPDGSSYAYAAPGECGDRTGIYIRAVAANALAHRLTNDCHVYGTNGPDHLVSSNQLFEIVDGRGGNDTIVARGAPYVGDKLVGGPGNDLLRGGFWPEALDGGPGDDTIYGDVNYDTLVGGPGHDRLFGQGGRDTIYARDGMRDVVDCGTNTGKTNTSPERDTAYVDRLDVVTHCERVFRSAR